MCFVTGKPAVASLPLTSIVSSPLAIGAAEPMVNFISSAVLSPIKSLCSSSCKQLLPHQAHRLQLEYWKETPNRNNCNLCSSPPISTIIFAYSS